MVSLYSGYHCVIDLISCDRLGVRCLAYLWRREQRELLSEMINCHVDAVLIKVAALGDVDAHHRAIVMCYVAGLNPEQHLGQSIKTMNPYLQQLVSNVIVLMVYIVKRIFLEGYKIWN